jgi:hypothetical protein
MKVSVVLADRGTNNIPQGTVNLLNAGWVQTQLQLNPSVPGGQVTPPQTVAIFYEVEHAYCNRPIELVARLLTEDGHAVLMPGPAGVDEEIRVGTIVTVPSPAMAPLGAPGTATALIEIFPGLMVPPGSYRWDVTLAGEHHDEWFASFRVLPPAQMPAFTFGSAQGPPPAAPAPPDEPEQPEE